MLWGKGEHNQTPLSQDAALKARMGVCIQTYSFLANLHFLSKTAGATSHRSSLPFQHGAHTPILLGTISKWRAKDQGTSCLAAEALLTWHDDGRDQQGNQSLTIPRCFGVIWNDILWFWFFYPHFLSGLKLATTRWFSSRDPAWSFI